MGVSINNVKTWPPGVQMKFSGPARVPGAAPVNDDKFEAIGIVVANDGIDTIVVFRPEHCKDRLPTYSVMSLNPEVISCVV